MKIICRNSVPDMWEYEYSVLDVTPEVLAVAELHMQACRKIDLGSRERKLSVFDEGPEVYSYASLFNDEGLSDEEDSRLTDFTSGELDGGNWVPLPEWVQLPGDACRTDCHRLNCWSCGKEDAREWLSWTFEPKYADNPVKCETQPLTVVELRDFLAASVSG